MSWLLPVLQRLLQNKLEATERYTDRNGCYLNHKIVKTTRTRAQRKASCDEQFKSPVAEHVAHSNYVIGWDDSKLIDKEPHKTTRWLKEAIWIKRGGIGNATMNKSEGSYQLNSIYDQLLSPRPPSTSGGRRYKKRVKTTTVVQ